MTVVHTHRDIVSTIASGASLFAVYRSSYNDRVDPIEVGHQQLAQTELWSRRAKQTRAAATQDRATFIDIDYDVLVNATSTCFESVYAAVGLQPPDDLVTFIAQYHNTHPAPATGERRYTPEHFGLDPQLVRERFAGLL